MKTTYCYNKILYSRNPILLVLFSILYGCSLDPSHVDWDEKSIKNIKHSLIYLDLTPLEKNFELSGSFTRIKAYEVLYNSLKKQGLNVVNRRPYNNQNYYMASCSPDYDGVKSNNKALFRVVRCTLNDPYKRKSIYSAYSHMYHPPCTAIYSNLAYTSCSHEVLYMNAVNASVDALSAIRKYTNLDQKSEYNNSIVVEVYGFDDGIQSRKSKDYEEAVLNAKVNAAKYAGSRIMSEQHLKIKSSSNGATIQLYNENTELTVDAILQSGYKIEDIGYTKSGYKVKLNGKVSIN